MPAGGHHVHQRQEAWPRARGPTSDSGIGCSVVSASGTRTNSDWPPCTAPPCCQVRGAQPKSDQRTHEDGEPLAAPGALAAGHRAGRQHAVARRRDAHTRADRLDRPDELVPEARAGREAEGLARVVDVEVRAADAGQGHAHDRVGRAARSSASGTSSTRTSCVPWKVRPLMPPPCRGRRTLGYARPAHPPRYDPPPWRPPRTPRSAALRADPGRARVAGVETELGEGMRCETTARGHEVAADEPRSLGGTDRPRARSSCCSPASRPARPSPTASGPPSSASPSRAWRSRWRATRPARLPRHGRGAGGLRAAADPGDARGTRGARALRELAAAVDRHCPVFDVLARPVPIERELRLP